MKKKILSGLLAFVLLFGSAAALPENVFETSSTITASATQSGDYEYKVLKDGTAEITKYNGKGGAVTIPSTIGGKKVTSIGEIAFAYCASITSVTIPKSVKSIGYRAFYDSNLTSVIIPKGVTSIESLTFYRCTNLKSVTIPSSVEKIGSYAFYECLSLKSITIPSSVKNIGGAAFMNCTSFKSITIPNSVTKIGDCAFEGCENLAEITIPESVVKIGDAAFCSCKNLKKIVLPSKIKSIEDSTFCGCRKLTSVIIPNSVTSIEDDAFTHCSSLTSITIPSSVTSIGLRAFWDCTSLKSVTIPSSVKSINDMAFGYYKYNGYFKNKVSGFTIYGVKGTAAQKYAKNNGFKFVAHRMTEPKVSRFAGANRYETAALISKGMYKNGTGTVIIATGMDYHDALVAVPLANAYNAPLLLTTDKQVTKQTEAELARLKAKKVIIVSTNGAVGSKVKAALAKYNPTMISGKTCFETASKVATALQKKAGKAPDTIFFATDSAFADALTASPVAAIKNAPIIYLNNKSIDSATANYAATELSQKL